MIMNVQTQPINNVQTAAVASPKTYSLKVKQAEIILFTTQLSVMIDSGVVLSDALTAIADQAKQGNYKFIVSNLANSIENGESFSEALARYPKVFDTMFISMVKASEASGEMPQMLDILSGYLDADAQTRRQVKGAMMYPMIMLILAVAATGSLMFFVLPKFSTIYASKGAALPKLTQLLLSLSSFFTNLRVMSASLTLTIAAVVGIYFWQKTSNGRMIIDWIKVNTPVIRTMFIDAILTRSMRIMATMVNTGVSMLDALAVIKLSSENHYFNILWTATDAKIRDGYQLSESILLSPYGDLVDVGIIQMLRAGEKSGKLAHVCDKVSTYYDKKLQSSIKMATTMIEPVMIILMGGLIGTIAIALLLPIFRISSVISH